VTYDDLLKKFCPTINRLCQGSGCVAYGGDEENGGCSQYAVAVGKGPQNPPEELLADNPADKKPEAAA